MVPPHHHYLKKVIRWVFAEYLSYMIHSVFPSASDLHFLSDMGHRYHLLSLLIHFSLTVSGHLVNFPTFVPFLYSVYLVSLRLSPQISTLLPGRLETPISLKA